MAAIVRPSVKPTKEEIQNLAEQIRQQPTNQIPASYYSGDLTFQVNARTRSIQVILQPFSGR